MPVGVHGLVYGCECIYQCLCVYTRVFMCLCVYVFVCAYTHICTGMCEHAHAYVCIPVPVCAHSNLCVYMGMHVCSQASFLSSRKGRLLAYKMGETVRFPALSRATIQSLPGVWWPAVGRKIMTGTNLSYLASVNEYVASHLSPSSRVTCHPAPGGGNPF